MLSRMSRAEGLADLVPRLLAPARRTAGASRRGGLSERLGDEKSRADSDTTSSWFAERLDACETCPACGAARVPLGSCMRGFGDGYIAGDAGAYPLDAWAVPYCEPYTAGASPIA